MKKIIIPFICGIAISGLLSFKALYDAKKSSAEVEQIQGVYVYAKCKPVKEYEFLGTVKGPKLGDHEFDNLVELMIRNAKKEFPSANAIIFDGQIKQTHNTKVSAVVIKD